MKVRMKLIVAAMLISALFACVALSSCAFRPDMGETLISPEIKPATGRMLQRPDGLDAAIPAPDIYWMYGDNFSQLIKDSQLILVGRVKSSREAETFLSIDSAASHEVVRETVTFFDVEPIQTIKGYETDQTQPIRVASYADIVYSTLDLNTLEQVEWDNSAPLSAPQETAIFFLKQAGGGVYFPVNMIQGVIELSGTLLMPQPGNDVISAGAELVDFIDSAEAVMNFKDEPTNESYRRFSVEEE